MLGNYIMPNYADLGKPLVDAVITYTMMEGSLEDSGMSISIMTIKIMHNLGLIIFLKRNHMVLQLAIRLATMPEGIIEDIVVTMVAWDYLDDFLILNPNKEGGYPMILG